MNFQQAPLQEVLQAVYNEILHIPLIIDADLSSVPPLTVALPNADNAQLQESIKHILANNGLVLRDNNGVSVISSKSKVTDSNRPTSTVYVYRPKHRPLTELSAFLQRGAGQGQVSSEADFAILTGTPEQVAIARYIAEQYDRPLQELMLKISVLEYSSTDESGVNFAALVSLLSGKININIGNANSLRDAISVEGSSYEAILSAISTDSNFSILETTHIRIANGKTARLNVGQEVPVLNQFTTTQTGQLQQSVTYRPAGLLIDIKPNLINDTVHATIAQQLSSFAVTQTSNIDSPTLFKRELLTEIAPNLGETVIMGGLDETKDNEARSTILGLPLGNNKSKSKSTLLMVVQFSLK